MLPHPADQTWLLLAWLGRVKHQTDSGHICPSGRQPHGVHVVTQEYLSGDEQVPSAGSDSSPSTTNTHRPPGQWTPTWGGVAGVKRRAHKSSEQYKGQTTECPPTRRGALHPTMKPSRWTATQIGAGHTPAALPTDSDHATTLTPLPGGSGELRYNAARMQTR